jgi:hypothetical protein
MICESFEPCVSLNGLAAIRIFGVFSVFLLAPLCKLCLTLGALVICLNHRQQTAGDAFNGKIVDFHATVFLTAEFFH